MTVTMSSEGDSAKTSLPEAKETSGTDNTDTTEDSQDVKVIKPENDTKIEEKETNDKTLDKTANASTPNENNANDKKPEEETKVEEMEKVNNTESTDATDSKEPPKDPKENDSGSKEDEKAEITDDKEEEGDGESEKDEKKKVPLLDEPLEKSGKRERKNVQRFNDEFKSEAKTETKVEIENGNGTALGDIPRVDASISRFKNDDLKLLHRVLFKVPGKTTLIKKNIRKFNGFEFKKDSDEYSKRIATVQRLEVKQLKSVCEMLDLQKTGNKEEISERILDFLLEPKDSGKPVGGGRPKRTAAVRANNRGYSSHDDYSSDERQTSRARRDKGKRSNLKDESSSESDKDFQPSDGSEEEMPPVSKRKRGGRKKASSDEEEMSDVSGATSDESDDEPKTKRRKSVKTNNKSKVKGTPGRRGRKPGSANKTRGRKKNESSEEEDEESDHKDEEGSSSEDEPLAKKTKNAQPPTDDEIKEYVKKILEGANLEEITMKTVCQRVYAHYPNFDLAHKKDFIKSTVKSLIST